MHSTGVHLVTIHRYTMKIKLTKESTIENGSFDLRNRWPEQQVFDVGCDQLIMFGWMIKKNKRHLIKVHTFEESWHNINKVFIQQDLDHFIGTTTRVVSIS